MLIKLSVVFGGGQLEGMRSCYFGHTHIQHSVSFVLFKLAIEDRESVIFLIRYPWTYLCQISDLIFLQLSPRISETKKNTFAICTIFVLIVLQSQIFAHELLAGACKEI